MYIISNDEKSTVVLEQENFKSFSRPNRFAYVSSFSKQPVRDFKLLNEAKQKLWKIQFLLLPLKTIIFLWENLPKT